MVDGDGSSRVLSRLFAAAPFIASAGSRIATLWSAICAVRLLRSQ